MCQRHTHMHTRIYYSCAHSLIGEAVPPVHVLPVQKITPKIRTEYREKLKPYPMMFNGRLVVACAVVAGGSSGGVTRDNIQDVMMEFEK